MLVAALASLLSSSGLVPPSSRGSSGAGSFAPAFDFTLGAPAGSIDTGANGVPQTGNHLLLVLLARSTKAAVVEANVQITLNGDTGLHYSRSHVRGLGGGVPATATAAAAAAWDLLVPGATPVAGVAASWLLLIPCYTQTTLFKAVSGQGGWASPTSADDDTIMFSGVWNQTPAINQVTLSTGADNLIAGSRLSIYLL